MAVPREVELILETYTSPGDCYLAYTKKKALSLPIWVGESLSLASTTTGNPTRSFSHSSRRYLSFFHWSFLILVVTFLSASYSLGPLPNATM